MDIKCKECKGTGDSSCVIDKTCPRCNGMGYHMDEDTLMINHVTYKAQIVAKGIVSDGCEGCDLKDIEYKDNCSERQPSCFCKVPGMAIQCRTDGNSIIWRKI